MASYNPYNIKIPMSWQGLNVWTGSYFPNSIKSRNNRSFWFWERSLCQRAQTTIIAEGLPEHWESELGVKDFFYFCLLRYGYLACFPSSEYGQTFQPCSLGGRNWFYQPVWALIGNPLLKKDSLKLKIGTDCAILKLTPDYCGIWDIITYYAEKLSHLDNAINTSLINSKMAFMLFARNKAASAAFKKAMDLINRGEPAVVLDIKLLNDEDDKEEPWQFWQRDHLKENYLTSDQLQDLQTILNAFDTEIGIPTVPYQKKERMVTDEANSKQADASARCTTWVDTLNSSVKEVNKILGTNISFRMRFDPEEEGGTDGDSEIDDDRDRAVVE